MNLSSLWQNKLAARGTAKHMLLTICLSGADPGTDTPHLALTAESYCYSTDMGAYVDTSYGWSIPFLPFLANWPVVKRELFPHERKASISDVTVNILADSGLAAILRDRGSTAGITARIDLWTPGVPLGSVIPRLAGVVTEARIDRSTSGVQLTITDGDPDLQVQWPQGPITREDFPDAPDGVVDIASRQSVFSAFNDPIPCWQIDAERREFYVCDPPLTVLPTNVQKGGEDVPTGWTAVNDVTDTGLAYTKIVFDSPVDEIAQGLTDEVTCSGGVGLTDTDPISFLLNIAQVELSASSVALLANYFAYPENSMPVLVDESAGALDIVRSRLIPQTPFAFSLHRNRAELINLSDWSSVAPIGIGNGLIFRLSQQQGQTAPEGAYNAFELICGGSAGGTARILRDAEHGPPDIRALCLSSQRSNSGQRRYLQMTLPDVQVQYDADWNVIGCALGEYLANDIVRLSALPHTLHGYQATWLHGLQLQLGQRMLLTDPDDTSLTDTPVYVQAIIDAPTGPQIIFQTQDAT